MPKNKIYITDHACESYINRFNPALASIPDKQARLTKTRNYIFMLFNNAEPVSTTDKGQMLLNREYNLKFIFRNGRIITLYPGRSKRERRNNKRRNKVVYKFIIITMPDGSKWKLSFAVLLVNYMNHKGTVIRNLSEIDKSTSIPSSTGERIKIIRSEFSWNQIRDLATCIKPPREVDYESGWRDGELELIDA
jgi:hypothetical protein